MGALDERFLAQDRPLGEARLLWEIGDGADVRALRARLNLDSGYLSRLLRRLEDNGLVELGPDARDRRVRTARLTAAGRGERAALDRASDELAESLLDPLTEAQRERLVRAMRDVERLLSVPLVRIDETDPADPRARHCLREYAAELNRRFPAGFDPARTSVSEEARELRPPEGLLLVVSIGDEPIGCGALRFHPGAPPDIKRMWVAESARGLGVGRRLLSELEVRAAETSRVVRLETNRTLSEAIAMYRSSGYVEVPPFNDEPYGDHWFEKRLAG